MEGTNACSRQLQGLAVGRRHPRHCRPPLAVAHLDAVPRDIHAIEPPRQIGNRRKSLAADPLQYGRHLSAYAPVRLPRIGHQRCKARREIRVPAMQPLHQAATRERKASTNSVTAPIVLKAARFTTSRDVTSRMISRSTSPFSFSVLSALWIRAVRMRGVRPEA